MTSIPNIESLPHAAKFEALLWLFRGLERVVTAYSGGVDSTLLMKAGTMALGEDCIGVIARSETLTDEEYGQALAIACDHSFRLETIAYSELEIEGYAENPTNRCYFCKAALFGNLQKIAKRLDAKTIAEGSNASDETDWRPGRQAAEELGVVSPLREAGLLKSEIRDISKALGLPNWNKPSAPCLSSRIAYGLRIDHEKLEQVAEGERILRNEGFVVLRVRHHGGLARIEVAPEEIERLLEPDRRRRIAMAMKDLGFRYVSVDLLGYRTGSLNEAFHPAQDSGAQ